jgi:uncharacterized lipoprotein YajG
VVTKMNYLPLLSALLLTGCATPPTTPTEPVAPQSATHYTAEDRCAAIFAILSTAARRGTPLAKLCRYGDPVGCMALVDLLERTGVSTNAQAATYCLEQGLISADHAMVRNAMETLPEFNRQMKRLNQKLKL